MREKNNLFIWGDNWWIENNKAWFVWGLKNIICCADLITCRYDLLGCIPTESSSRFRITPGCIKYQDDIYCMPSVGKSIWIYNIADCNFDKIDIDNRDNAPIGIQELWIYGNKIYAVSIGLKQIIEINPDEKRIDNYYQICKEGVLVESTKVGSLIYSLDGESGRIYQFDLIKKETVLYELPKIGKIFDTVCFDGEKFWLSGRCKEVYVWDKRTNEIEIVDGFPKDFGIYDFTKDTDGKADCIADEYKYNSFLASAAVGENVWFIPFCTNKIIYINKQNYQIKVFEINEEIETKESILARTSLGYKYVMSYVKDDRYIGLYSIKHNCILEIDTVELKYEYKQYVYTISDRCLKDYAKLCNNFFSEQNDAWGQKIYEGMICSKDSVVHGVKSHGVGVDIYRRTAYDVK